MVPVQLMKHRNREMVRLFVSHYGYEKKERVRKSRGEKKGMRERENEGQMGKGMY